MNALFEDVRENDVSAYSFALAGLARLATACTTLDDGVSRRLDALGRRYGSSRTVVLKAFGEYAKRPHPRDAPLFAAAAHFGLTTAEILSVRLAAATEEDVLANHLLAHLQQPLCQSRPTIGLLAQAYGEEHGPSAVHVLAQGEAVRCGLLQLSADASPLPERHVRIALPNSLALQGVATEWPGVSAIGSTGVAMELGRVAEGRAATLGARLQALGEGRVALLIRGGDVAEARAAAGRVCSVIAKRPVLVHGDRSVGMAPWLFLNALVPVFALWLGPGDRNPVPAIPHHRGPVVVLTGPEGDFEFDEGLVLEWRLETPAPAERVQLWAAWISDPHVARRVAVEHRHTAGRIAALGAAAKEAVGYDVPVRYEDIRTAARRGDVLGLGALADVIADEVEDAALVMPALLREELESLVVRCKLREHFADGLGPSIRARYRPSVRALFVGPSGTGKTLAAAWLATRLGMPLCRVDLAAVTSKYIGETEKNLSQLLSRAERNEVVLLFDEADSLFGKRTDIHDSNDRFANAQTNYLLARMESYDGITVLTSNGRSRFDAAFSRRFDAILTFVSPGPQERRALWSAHLGARHTLTVAQLNRLSAVAELSGGQIRNAVLRGAVAAASDGEAIAYRHVLAGVTGEYRKLSRQLPSDLKPADGLESG